MIAFISGTTGLNAVFMGCAVVGGLVFIIRTLMMFIGGIGDDGDGDGGMDGDMDGGMDDISDSDVSFNVLTVQGVTVFIMMFGLVGLCLRLEFKQGAVIAIIGAMAAGLASIWIISKVMRSMARLQSSGTIDMNNAVGQKGTIYLTIPAEGTGKARVVIQGRLKVVEAAAENKEEIKTGERIVVVDTVNSTVIVKKES